jgi:hypothetical protein
MLDNASRTLFSGVEVLHPNDLCNAEVANFGNNIDNRLREHYKWKGQALGTIGLTLSSDNERVIGGLFITRGATKFKELKVSCNLIWPESTLNIILALSVPSLDIFSFDAGGLWSEIVPSQSEVHSFHGGEGCVVLADERHRMGVGDFSVPMRKAGQPDVLPNGGEVLEKWGNIRSNSRLLLNTLPVTMWPPVKASPEPEGKVFSIIVFFSVATALQTFKKGVKFSYTG